MTTEVEKFYGKYRGTVRNNADPLNQGRLQVTVPAILGEEMPSWAMPCVPFAGMQVGMFAMPPINSNVWVEFEAGDANKPIWVGSFWGMGENPATPPLPTTTVIKTLTGEIKIDEIPGAGGISLSLVSGASIKLSTTGIEITNGLGASIKLQGPMVSINNGTFEVLM